MSTIDWNTLNLIKTKSTAFLTSLLLGFTLYSPVTLASEEPFFEKHNFYLAMEATVREYGKNFSGIAVTPEKDTYMAIDDDCHLFKVEVTENSMFPGERVKITGLDDCEALVLDGDGRIAIADERRGNIAWANNRFDVPYLNCYENCEIHHIDDVARLFRSNAGLESVALDDEGGYYTAKEYSPRKIYHFRVVDDAVDVKIPWNAELLLPEGGDIADLFYFEGSLFLLDQVLEAIYQLNPETGTIISQFQLPPNSHIMYEGLAIKKRGREHEIAIVAEDSEIFIFREK